jgi:hypothetical protein
MSELTKPSEIFHKEVFPAYLDYLRDQRSERYAKIAAKAVSDQVEWTFKYYQKECATRLNGAKTVGEFRRQLIARCPELHILWDVGDAAKHRFLDVPSKRRDPQPLIHSSTAAYSEASGGELMLDGKPYLPILKAAVDFWKAWSD